MWGLVLVCLLGAGSLWAQGDVSFLAARVTPTPGTSVAVAGGDFNGDGRADVFLITSSPNAAVLLLGQSDGSLQPTPALPAGVSLRAVAAGDFNADGRLDVAVATAAPNTVVPLLGWGDGTFQVMPPAAVGGPFGASMLLSLGDSSGDGVPDLAVANQASSSVSFWLG
jgi:hypothetical protein